jgi:hypothetical protein
VAIQPRRAPFAPLSCFDGARPEGAAPFAPLVCFAASRLTMTALVRRKRIVLERRICVNRSRYDADGNEVLDPASSAIHRCDAGREEKEAPAAGASVDVSSAGRVLKTPAISGIYIARLKQPGNVNSSALMPVLGRKPFKYLSLAVSRRNETRTPGAVLARRMGLRMPALEAQWDRQGPARRGPDGRLAHQRLGQHMDRMHRGAPREIGDLMAT